MSEDGVLPPWRWPSGPGAALAYDLQRDLEEAVAELRSVFLDVNFWIDCRDAKFDADASEGKRHLYQALLAGVGEGRLFCPISSDILTELTKQDDQGFAATMAVIDELTLGVSLVPHRERMVIEAERFIGRFDAAMAATHRPIWTAFVFAFGYQDLWPPAPAARTENVLLTMTRGGWTMPPSRGVAPLRSAVTNAKEESEQAAARLNKGFEDHRELSATFASVLADEMGGAADLLADTLCSEYDRMAGIAGAAPSDRGVRNILTQMAAAGMLKPEGRRAFGSIVVPATLYAAFRTEKQRRVKPNDVFDFRHAAAALPHCNAFFTEGKLGRLMASGHVALTRSYPCRVASDPAAALRVLEELGVA